MLLGIRSLIGLKNIIVISVTTIIKPFLKLGKFFLYRPFVRLYYLIFRVKKYDLGQQSGRELIKKKSVHLVALTLILLAFILNLTDKKQASAAVGKTTSSVMAEIVRDEFGDTGQNNDELIEDSIQITNKETLEAEKYLSQRDAITAPKGIITNIEEKIEIINDVDNMITKPKQIVVNDNNTTTTTTTTTDNTKTEREETITYTVQAGDTISTIARRYDLNVNTVLWANNLSAFSIIRAGDSLTVLPTDGFLYKVVRGDTLGKLAQVYDVSTDKIITSNHLNNAGTIAIGQQLIIPGTKRVISNTSTVAKTTTQSSYTGIEVIKDIVTTNKPIVSSNKMVWPTEGHRITQYFSWQHNGLDIGNKVGTPLYAADSGIVEISQGGYNGGYGNTILLNHGGGKKTRYGHASKLLVSKGEEVEKGQVIALMGSTGRSTGPHLHFEVVINGTRYNPLNYIK